MEKKRKQSNREYSSDVLSKQGSTLHMQHYQGKAVYVDWAAEMPESREGLVLSKTSIFSGLAESSSAILQH
jgi:hypothetical protein